MGHDVDAGGSGQAARGGHAVVGVDDSHVGEQRVVGERPLDAGLLVGDDGERRALGAGTRRGRDGDEVGLLAHLGESEDTLADVHEVHGHVLKLALGVLVHHPHDLAGVHSGATADGDDDVRLKESHLLGAATCALQRRIGLDVVEAVVGDAHLVELGLDGAGVAILEEELVGDDEGALLAHDGTELVEGDGRGTLLEVDLLGSAEPQHVLTALGHSLNVDQVLHPNVLGDGVAAPGAAAQGQRRLHAKVVQVTDAAVRGRGVDDDTAGLHDVLEQADLLGLGGVHVQRGGVARATGEHQVLGLVDGLLEVLGMVHGQDRGELLVGELLLGGVGGGDLGDQDLGLGGNLDAGELGDLGGSHAGDAVIEGAVLEHGGTQGLHLGTLLDEVAAALLELGLNLVIDGVDDGHGLLGSADHAVVEGLGVDDGVDGEQHVGGVVDDDRGVTGANAQGGLARGVGGLDHARATGGEDDVDVAHDHVGQLDGGDIDPADDALGGAGLDGGVKHELGGGDGALGGSRVRGDDDGVAGLQADQRLEDRSGGGVGRRDDGAHDADGLGDLGDAVGLVALQDTTGLGVLVSVVDVLCGVVVLDDLVLKNAAAGLLDGHLRQRDTSLVGGHGGLIEDLVDLLLRVRSKKRLGLSHLSELSLKRLYVVHNCGSSVFR